jgi:integrase
LIFKWWQGGDLNSRFLIPEKEILMAATGEGMENRTVSGWLAEWLTRRKALAKASTYERYSYSVKRFLSFLGDNADRPLVTLTSATVRRWRDSVKAEGRAGKTINGYLKDIRAAMLAAVKEGIIARSPAATVETLPEDDSVEKLPFTTEELVVLLDAAPDKDWRGMILLGAFGGMRIRDAATLKAGTVDIHERIIKYRPMKTSRKKRDVSLPMAPPLAEYFHGFPLGDDPEGFLFPSLVVLSKGRAGPLSKAFRKIMVAAGIGVTASGTTARQTQAKSFHSLRHTFTSWLAAASVPEELRMQLTGHSTRDVHQQYTHHQLEGLRAAVGKLTGKPQTHSGENV